MKPSKISKIKKKIIEDIINIYEQNLELKDLVGEHILTGVDFNNQQIKDYGDEYQICQVIRFTLDGKTYIACEDPEDGYRSCMRWIRLSKETINNLEPIKILARMNDKCNTITLQILNIKNGKIILEIGTDNEDSYYPNWIAEFHKENLNEV